MGLRSKIKEEESAARRIPVDGRCNRLAHRRIPVDARRNRLACERISVEAKRIWPANRRNRDGGISFLPVVDQNLIKRGSGVSFRVTLYPEHRAPGRVEGLENISV